MEGKNLLAFRVSCENYLSELSLNALRSYGIFLRLKAPTAMKKAELVKEIVAVLCGELVPKRSALGAPVKNVYVDPVIIATIEKFEREFLNGETLVPPSSKESSPSAVLKIEVNTETLNQEQKQLLNTFLISL